MGVLSKLTKRKEDMEEAVRAKEEVYISLIRVYIQSVMAVNLGVTNVKMLPDLVLFKRKLSIQTQGGRLGIAEKSTAKKYLINDYGLDDNFFAELDSSIRRICKKQQDSQRLY